ncbi:hypothetical protein E2C01_073009 [Portunus trituberculatus]|uniref:Uncharacterized protein n=1 Tax=Portunus trituberculatus TaxID=210409 RepID=A0A5B7HZL8_PORTR|nr:hypothetical protein [Portunus trituberculatus]
MKLKTTAPYSAWQFGLELSLAGRGRERRVCGGGGKRVEGRAESGGGAIGQEEEEEEEEEEEQGVLVAEWFMGPIYS